MGSMYSASCECGFSRTVRVGGGMRDHRTNSAFPFYCGHCGMVSVNISQDQLICPQCESLDVIPYGDQRITETSGAYKSVQWGNYASASSGNLCPDCHKKTMKFSLEMLFD